MPLAKQPVSINFSQGLETKTDAFQIPVGKFLSLQNSVFTKGGLLQKRNGYSQLTALPDATSNFVTTFNGNLTAIGSNLEAFASGSQTWINKGSLQPASVLTLPLIRSNTNQTQADAVVSPNGLVCTAYSDSNGSTTKIKYAVADSTTGQNIIPPSLLVAGSGGTVTGAPRVFLLGNFFIIVFSASVSGTAHLQYVAININSLVVSLAADVSTTYAPATTLAFDGYVANNNLYIALNGSDSGGAVRVTYIDSTLTQHNTVVIASNSGSYFSVTADTTGSTAVVYVSFYNSSTPVGKVYSFTQSLIQIASATFSTSASIVNIASAAENGSVTIFQEITNSYSYSSTIPNDPSNLTNYIQKVSVTQAGTVGSTTIVDRSVGLASKAFIVNSVMYFVGIYVSLYQPTYFLIDQSGNVLSRIAYENGGGYYLTGLPSVTVTGTMAKLAYFFKDLSQAANKTQGQTQAGIYTQTGINLLTVTIGTTSLTTAEIGSNLNISGGFLWSYDGYQPVEQNFFIWPDHINATSSAGVTPTGNTTSGSASVTVSSATGIGVGSTISGTGIPGATTVLAVNGTTLLLSANATATGTGVTLTIAGNMSAQTYYYQVTYEWSDNQGNIFRSAPSVPVSVAPGAGASSTIIQVPTLRLTYKISNPVKIVVYRWSAMQQNYFQVTSITSPVLNDPTVDSVTFVDTLADMSIAGNELIYTTGGVVEDTGTPPTSIMTLFKSRLVLVDAEDPNLLWYSKQVIEATPVEMSDLFTIYIAPTTSAQGATGPITALSVLDDKLIIFKKDAIYYITGTGPDNTGANNDFSDPVFITSTVGCANQQSIVFMPQGLMFQSDKGIWLLGRDLSTQYIGSPVEAFNSYLVNSSVNVPATNQVRFTLSNGQTLMYDYFYGQWGSFVGVPCISSTLYQSLHTFINALGQVFQESPGLYLDGSNPTLMSFTTSWLNLAGLQGYERAYFMYILGSYISPHKLNIQIAYDYAVSPEQTVVITPANIASTYGTDPLYGNSYINGQTMPLEQWRVFFTKQKITAFQVTLNEVFDPSYGTTAGAGLTISGLDMIVGLKKGYRPIVEAKSTS